MAAPVLPTALPNAASIPANIKAALPAITVMAVDGSLKFIEAIIILAAGWWLSRWVCRGIHRALNRTTYVDDTLKPLISNFVRYGILLITIVAVLGQFGVQTTSLIAVVGAAGLAVGLALQGTLSNVASGVMILLLRPFRVHDNIVGGGTSGTVQEIGLFQTVLTTDDGVYVTVPNSTLFSGVVTNNSRQQTHRVNVTFDIDYRSDVDKALAIVTDIVNRDPRIVARPAPVIQVASLSGAAVNIQVLAWASSSNAAAVQSDLLKVFRGELAKSDIHPALPPAWAALQKA
jgi:small conductance mechanosensitive channel